MNWTEIPGSHLNVVWASLTMLRDMFLIRICYMVQDGMDGCILAAHTLSLTSHIVALRCLSQQPRCGRLAVTPALSGLSPLFVRTGCCCAVRRDSVLDVVCGCAQCQTRIWQLDRTTRFKIA